jgi:heptosyltransferase II
MERSSELETETQNPELETLNPEPEQLSDHSFSKSERTNKILIRLPNWVGDAVMAIPALRELRRIFRASQITLAGRPWVLGLFEDEGLDDHTITIEDSNGALDRCARFLSETDRYRRERFDWAVLLTNSFATALAAWAGRAKKVGGYPTDSRKMLLDYAVPFQPGYKTLHQIKYYLNIAAQIEIAIAGRSSVDFDRCEPRLDSPSDTTRGLELLERFGINAERGILAINPGATNSTAKRWPAERFASTADKFSDAYGFQTVIIGTAGDKPVALQVAESMRAQPTVIAGETSIADLKALLRCVRLVISNDTGTSHVAAALGVPTVVVFGPTEHVATRPLSDRAIVVRHDVECSPCMLRECPIDHRCMMRVEVNDVYTAARRLLALS